MTSSQKPFLPPRYLTAFHPKTLPHCFVDVLVIGSGIAGLRACLEISPTLSTLLVTKDSLEQSNSHYAQGGLASVFEANDSFENHVEDTMIAGAGLCERKTVELVVREAPRAISQLLAWGTRFDKKEETLLLGREGGHSHNRIVHAMGDATGSEVIRAMIERVQQRPNIRTWENTYTLDLLTERERCRGAIVQCRQRGRQLIWAKQIILCTGGAGKLYRETTNPSVATGDGHAVAYRAGAKLSDMEFMQFHPTVLYIAGSSRSLISEAVRGEGAILVDKDGYRFMPEYDKRAELAPRDVVSQAIAQQMRKTHHPNVYLDLGHLDAAYVRKRFPGISKACLEFDLDIATDRIPVRPGAHYMIGGVKVDRNAKTSIDRLWAAGEVTRSGLHGANRLASNSLPEGMVYGAIAGRGASDAAEQIADDFHIYPISFPEVKPSSQMLDIDDIRNSLQSLLWRAVGVQRNEESMLEAAEAIETWCRYVLPRQFKAPAGWELQNLLTVASLVTRSALNRKESRGVHLRDDYPETDDTHWKHSQEVEWKV